MSLLTIETSILSLWSRHDDTPSSNTAVSSTPPAAARGGTAPHAGKIVVPEGAAHGYELVEQLTALPQRRVHDGRSSSLAALRHESTASEWQPGDDWGADDAPVQRWLDAGGGSSIEGFCAADLHPAAAFPQLAPAASALVEVLAGLPMRIGQEPEAAADDAGPHAAAGQLEPRDHSSSHSASRNQEGQELPDYSLQDSFARGHFGEGLAACSSVPAQMQLMQVYISSAPQNTFSCWTLGGVAAVWRGVRRVHTGAKDGSGGGGGGQHFVLKRLMVEHGMEVSGELPSTEDKCAVAARTQSMGAACMPWHEQTVLKHRGLLSLGAGFAGAAVRAQGGILWRHVSRPAGAAGKVRAAARQRRLPCQCLSGRPGARRPLRRVLRDPGARPLAGVPAEMQAFLASAHQHMDARLLRAS